MDNTHPVAQPGPRAILWRAIGLFGVLVVGLVSSIFLRQLRTRDLPDTRVMLASIARSDSAVATLLTQPIWSETRGHQERSLATEARAVRLGAALAELEVRRLRRDSIRVRADDIVQMLQTFPDSDDAVRAFQALEPTSDDKTLRSAIAAVERAAGRRAVRLGAWLQSARFAAATGDSSLFEPAALSYVARTAVAFDPRPETEYAVRQFETITRERPRDWVATATAVDELLRLLGTR